MIVSSHCWSPLATEILEVVKLKEIIMENNQVEDDQNIDLQIMGWSELFKREQVLDEREEKINRDGKRWLERDRALAKREVDLESREAVVRKRKADLESRVAAVGKWEAELESREAVVRKREGSHQARKTLSHMQVRRSLKNFFPDFNERIKELIGHLEANPSLFYLRGYLSSLEQPLTQYKDPRSAENVLVAYYGPLQYMEQVLRAPGLLGGEIYTLVIDLMNRIREEMTNILTREELVQRTFNSQVRFHPGAICAPIRDMPMTGRNRRDEW